MSFEIDQRLRDIAANAYGLSTPELLWVLEDQRYQTSEAYEALLIRVREVFTTRYTSAQVTNLLGHLNRPKRDTMVQMHRSKQ